MSRGVRDARSRVGQCATGMIVNRRQLRDRCNIRNRDSDYTPDIGSRVRDQISRGVRDARSRVGQCATGIPVNRRQLSDRCSPRLYRYIARAADL